MPQENLWTGFNGRKLAAERAKKDWNGRELSTIVGANDSTVTITAGSNSTPDGTFTLNQSTNAAITLAAATTSTDGVMSSTDKTKLDGIATGATKVEDGLQNGDIQITDASGNVSQVNVYTHATNGADTIKGETADVSPGFGGKFKVLYAEVNQLGHTTDLEDYEVTIPDAVATTTDDGLMSSTDKSKLDGIASGADENVIEEVQVNGTALTPDASKAVNVVIPVTGVQRNGTDLAPDANHKVNVEVPVLGVQIEGDANPLTPDSTTKIVEIPLATASGSGVTGNSGVISAGDLADLEYLATAKPSGASANNPLITQTDLQTAIADFGGFKEVPGDPTTGEPSLPSGETPSTKIIYLTEDTSATGNDKFREWLYDSTTSSWKLIGDTTMSMIGYAKIPSSYTAGHLVEFTSTDTLADSGKTAADLENTVESVSIGSGTAITPASGSTNIVIPLAANNSGTGTDGAMSGADKVKLDGIATGAQVNTVETVSINGGTPVQPDTNKNVDLTVSIPSASSTTPVMDGTGAVGTSTDYARADHEHPSDTAKADKVASATDGHLAGLNSSGNLTDSGIVASDVILGVQLEGAQSALTPSSGVVTIPNAVATTGQNPTNGLMTSAQATELDQIAAWTWSYAQFDGSGAGTEQTSTFPFTVS